jgi:hypothetical protein
MRPSLESSREGAGTRFRADLLGTVSIPALLGAGSGATPSSDNKGMSLSVGQIGGSDATTFSPTFGAVLIPTLGSSPGVWSPRCSNVTWYKSTIHPLSQNQHLYALALDMYPISILSTDLVVIFRFVPLMRMNSSHRWRGALQERRMAWALFMSVRCSLLT